jgi:hypothetical protein
MSAYVAMARVERSHVRALAWEPRPRDADIRAAATAHEEASLVVDREPWTDHDERWSRFRDQLSMTAFFLLDPDSWR